ncbi:YSC84-related protein [Thalassotalea sp. PLHSN55]|uniref:lipid-binding SYLF domain-containing protein n=1 Tax=Thalassotalea sp. PLHSN55 TaxID=3435888 RepID=UPI003F82DEC0
MKKLMVLFTALLMFGCASTSGDSTVAEQRAELLKMRNQVLADLYKQYPYTKKDLQQAPGYAVFSNAQINVIFAAVGGGHGVVHNNQTGKNVFMKMGEGGLGLGMGVKDFRSVFIFKTQKALDDFIKHGWSVGAEADAAIKASDKGAEYSGSATVGDIEIYQMTDSGLAIQATLKGTKYWKSDELN